MAIQVPKKKGFFARYWGLIFGGVAIAGIVLIAAGVLVYLFVVKGSAKVTEVGLSTDTIVYGEELKAIVKVENPGLLAFDYHASLLVDGTEGASQDITLESKQPQALKLDISDLKPGEHKISIGGKEKDFKVLKPAKFEVSDINIEQETVLAGDTITVKATISNSGEIAGDYSAKFTYDGAESGDVKVNVGPGEKETVEAQMTVKVKGKHTVALEDQKKTFDALVPATISITGFKLSKAFVKPDEAVSVTASLENTGDVAGEFSLELVVNGTTAQIQKVTVEGKGKAVHTFTYSQSAKGKCVIKIGEKSETLYVVTIARPNNGTFLISKAKATSGTVGYMQIYNNISNKDALFVLTTTGSPKTAVLAVFVRSGQNVMRFFVKSGTYLAYYTAGGNFDTSSRRFFSSPEYWKCSEKIDLKNYWYQLVMPANYYSKISEADFPK